jgi:hypothetical protein
MATYKNTTGFPQSIARDGVEYNVADGATVEVPDDDLSFDARPGWSKSSAKSPDVTVDPEPAAVEPQTAPSVPNN